MSKQLNVSIKLDEFNASVSTIFTSEESASFLRGLTLGLNGKDLGNQEETFLVSGWTLGNSAREESEKMVAKKRAGGVKSAESRRLKSTEPQHNPTCVATQLQHNPCRASTQLQHNFNTTPVVLQHNTTCVATQLPQGGSEMDPIYYKLKDKEVLHTNNTTTSPEGQAEPSEFAPLFEAVLAYDGMLQDPNDLVTSFTSDPQAKAKRYAEAQEAISMVTSLRPMATKLTEQAPGGTEASQPSNHTAETEEAPPKPTSRKRGPAKAKTQKPEDPPPMKVSDYLVTKELADGYWKLHYLFGGEKYGKNHKKLLTAKAFAETVASGQTIESLIEAAQTAFASVKPEEMRFIPQMHKWLAEEGYLSAPVVVDKPKFYRVEDPE